MLINKENEVFINKEGILQRPGVKSCEIKTFFLHQTNNQCKFYQRVWSIKRKQ